MKLLGYEAIAVRVAQFFICPADPNKLPQIYGAKWWRELILISENRNLLLSIEKLQIFSAEVEMVLWGEE